MKVGLITTLKTNIGDDFIRLGVQRVLRSMFPEESVRWECLNKHQPNTLWPLWHPCRYLPAWLPRGQRAAQRLGKSRFHGCDWIVQCGAPVIWKNCACCEWNEPIWQGVVRDLHVQIPVMNLAVGSAYSLSAVPERIESEADRDYIRSILGYCRLTTARDRLAQRLVAELGIEIPRIPCSAGLVFDVPEANHSSNTVFVNYMPKAGHYDFCKDIDEAIWDRVLAEVLERVSKSFRVVFLCHDKREHGLAAARFPRYERELPASPEGYYAFAKNGFMGIFNRLHAAVAFAGMGIPSVTVGNDTRLWMVDEYGLPTFDVRQCTAEAVWTAFENLARRRNEERKRLLTLRSEIMKRYVREISTRSIGLA